MLSFPGSSQRSPFPASCSHTFPVNVWFSLETLVRLNPAVVHKQHNELFCIIFRVISPVTARKKRSFWELKYSGSHCYLSWKLSHHDLLFLLCTLSCPWGSFLDCTPYSHHYYHLGRKESFSCHRGSESLAFVSTSQTTKGHGLINWCQGLWAFCFPLTVSSTLLELKITAGQSAGLISASLSPATTPGTSSVSGSSLAGRSHTIIWARKDHYFQGEERF